MTISPWTRSCKVESPNKKFTAEIFYAEEIAMGAPSGGLLTLSNGFSINRCNTSIVWSDDSRYLAVPRWTENLAQRLMIIDVANNKVFYDDKLYRVLELHEFKGNTVYGIDSPIHKPEKLEVNVSELIDDSSY